MVGSQLGAAFSNPKLLAKTAMLSLLVFGAFHFTKLGAGVFGQVLMSRFGKPNLVRETSKLYTNNYALIPFL